MKTKQPKINEIVNYLSSNDKTELDSLKSTFPKFQHLLEPGIILEEKEDLEKDKHIFILTTTKTALEVAFKKANPIFEKTKSNLKKLNRLDFYSQIVALFSGCAILATLQNEYKETFGFLVYIAPSLVLISSLLSLYAKNKAKSFIGGSNDLYHLTDKYIGLNLKGKETLRDIASALKYFDLEEAKPIISSAKDIINGVEDFIIRAS